MLNWSSLDLGLLGPAFIAGVLVLATHVVLGIQVLDRGIVFIDLAIAQMASLGVIAADTLGLPEGGIWMQASAVVAALLGAALLTWTERRAPRQQEALIGAAFVLSTCAGIMLVSGNPHGGEHLRDLLVGQILWVGMPQLLSLAAVTGALLIAMRAGWLERLGRFGFYGAFAVAVTASVQVVGVYLVFASLIFPALGARSHDASRQYRLALISGIAGYASGLMLSALFDLPSGAVIVWTLAACALACAGLRLVSTPEGDAHANERRH